MEKPFKIEDPKRTPKTSQERSQRTLKKEPKSTKMLKTHVNSNENEQAKRHEKTLKKSLKMFLRRPRGLPGASSKNSGEAQKTSAERSGRFLEGSEASKTLYFTRFSGGSSESHKIDDRSKNSKEF